jgi:hypothetical protein
MIADRKRASRQNKYHPQLIVGFAFISFPAVPFPNIILQFGKIIQWLDQVYIHFCPPFRKGQLQIQGL